MVKLLSPGGDATRALLLGTDLVSGFLIVTDFLDDSGLRLGAAGFACFVATAFFTAAAFGVTVFFCAWVTLAALTGTTLATFFAGFAATTFFAAGFLTTVLRATTLGVAFAATFFGVAAFTDFFATATDFTFCDDLDEDACDPRAMLRAATFARTGAGGVFARLLVFCLI